MRVLVGFDDPRGGVGRVEAPGNQKLRPNGFVIFIEVERRVVEPVDLDDLSTALINLNQHAAGASGTLT
jgi:hypothetical protein